MTGGKIEAFLKLFCITDSSHSSWQSWTVFCICLASAVATASSGSYFQRTSALKSSTICFIVSTAGFCMALVTLIAVYIFQILIGCKRRRRILDPETTHGDPTIYVNPVVSGPSTSIEIEEDPSESQYVDQMWMNPVFAEYDKSLYEADWNTENDNERRIEKHDDNERRVEKHNEIHFEKDNDTDFDQRDSDCFHSSSDTVTWSYKSYSEDEGYFPHSFKESNLKEAGKSSLECHWKPLSVFQETLEDSNSGQASTSDVQEAGVSSLKRHKKHMSMPQEGLKDVDAQCLEMLKVPGNAVTVTKQTFPKGNLPIAPHNSKFSQFKFSRNMKSNRVFSNCSRSSSSSASCFESEIISNNDLAFVKKDGLHYENELELDFVDDENELELDFIDDENVTHFYDSSLTTISDTNSGDNSFAYEEHDGKRSIESLQPHNVYVTPEFIKKDTLEQFEEKNYHSKYIIRHKVSKSSEHSDECHILSNSNKDSSTVVEVEDHTKSTEFSIRRNQSTTRIVSGSTVPHEASSLINEVSYSNLSHFPHTKNQNRHSINKFDYPSLSYPVFDEDYSNFENVEREESEELFIPRYKKRPLLDVNGVPISQKELVKVITKLLIGGLQDEPKNTS